MYQLSTLKNGLPLITINLPHLESVTSMIAIGAGSRYENQKISGISHFLEHMFFKGSKKYPSSLEIASLIDNIGAVNNAATSKEFTFYWIKSASGHLSLASDILSSQVKDSLLKEEEIEREKGVIIEEIRMYKDMPSMYIFSLFENLLFGDQPLGRDIAGSEETVSSLKRGDFISYMDSLYSPENMVLIYVGKLPDNILDIANTYFSDLPKRSKTSYLPFQKQKQTKIRLNIFDKKTDQAHLVLGVEGFDRKNSKRFASKLLATILGEGMSSRLFTQIREKRGWAYHVNADHESYLDSGVFAIYAGLKLEKALDGLKVIKEEVEKVISEKVTEGELKKAKEMEKGRLAIRSESTNFLAQHFGIKMVLDNKLETFEDYLKQINQVSATDIQTVAKELFNPERLNLQVLGPFKKEEEFEKIVK